MFAINIFPHQWLLLVKILQINENMAGRKRSNKHDVFPTLTAFCDTYVHYSIPYTNNIIIITEP